MCSVTNLLFDLVLNIGNPVTEAIPFGVRFVDAILIAAACRNAGYQPIPVSSLVPAAQYVSSSTVIFISELKTNQGTLRGHDVHFHLPNSDEVRTMRQQCYDI